MPMIAVDTPSGKLRIRRSSCIGHYFIIACLGERFLANCIDATPDDRPKRMRLQHSLTHGGKVVQPHEYTIIEQDPDWED